MLLLCIHYTFNTVLLGDRCKKRLERYYLPLFESRKGFHTQHLDGDDWQEVLHSVIDKQYLPPSLYGTYNIYSGLNMLVPVPSHFHLKVRCLFIDYRVIQCFDYYYSSNKTIMIIDAFKKLTIFENIATSDNLLYLYNISWKLYTIFLKLLLNKTCWPDFELLLSAIILKDLDKKERAALSTTIKVEDLYPDILSYQQNVQTVGAKF